VIETQAAGAVGAPTRPAVIDCDIHNVVPSHHALMPFLSDHWRDYVSQTSFKGPVDTPYPPNAPTSARPGGAPPDGGPAGSSLALVREQALDAWGTEIGILTCAYAIESVHNPDAAAAMASAVNDWQVAEWLEQEPRLRASLVVPVQQPAMAAREIERRGDHPGIVQVFLPVHTKELYGSRVYYPLFDAIAAHDLVVGLHFGGAPGYPPTASGWPSYYIEEYVGAASIFQSQILNMIVEGLFDRYPNLRVALIEGGFTWMPSLMWRMDKEWKGLRREVPWNRMLPSEYVRRHMRLTLQPLDEPPDAAAMLEVIEQLGSDELLMFSTDYPHYHFDSPDEALPAGLPDDLRRKILAENARAFYRLGSNEQ
jgi:uncharacterized protein